MKDPSRPRKSSEGPAWGVKAEETAILSNSKSSGDFSITFEVGVALMAGVVAAAEEVGVVLTGLGFVVFD